MEKVHQLFPDSELNCQSPSRLRRNISMYVINMLQHNGTVAISRRPEQIVKFNSPWHTHHYANMAINALVEANLVDFERGHWNFTFNKGFSSRIKTNSNFSTLFHFVPLQPSLDLENNNLPNVIHNHKKDVSNTINILGSKQLQLIEKQVERLNKHYFSQMELTHKTINTPTFLKNVHLTRVFQDDGCGRFYQLNGTSYQNISKEERNGLLINGKETTEVDYTSMHLHLLYHRQGIEMPFADAYKPILDTLGLCEYYRPEIKKVVLTALNALSRASFIKSFNPTEDGREIKNKLKQGGITLDDVCNAFVKCHPAIAQYLNSGASIGLMLLESDIMQIILLKLMHLGILALPLHDSLVCKIEDVEAVKQVMLMEYKIMMGFSIGVKVKNVQLVKNIKSNSKNNIEYYGVDVNDKPEERIIEMTEVIKDTDELSFIEEMEEEYDGRAVIRKVTDYLKSEGCNCAKCTVRDCLTRQWFKKSEDDDLPANNRKVY